MSHKVFAQIRKLTFLPEQIRVFVVTALLVFIGALLWKYQRTRFILSIAGILSSIAVMFFSSYEMLFIFLWGCVALPMSMEVKTGPISVHPIEAILVIFFACLFIDLLLGKARSISINWTAIHTIFLIFLSVFGISAIIGLSKGYYGSAFRSDFFRGPNYYTFIFVFSYFCKNYPNIHEKLARHWLYATLASIFIFVLAHIWRFKTSIIVEYATAGIGGINLQTFSISVGLTFLLGFIASKKWWFATVVQMLALTYARSRTTFIGAILSMLLVLPIYNITLPKGKRMKFLWKWVAVVILITIIAAVIVAFFLATPQSKLASTIAWRYIILLKPKYALYQHSIQSRYIETLEAIAKVRDSSFLFGDGLGTRFVSMVGIQFFIDVLYALIYAKMGFLGLISFLAIFAVFLYVCIWLLVHINEIEAPFLKAFAINATASIPVFMIMAFAMSHLWFSRGTIVTLCLYIAVCLELRRRIMNKRQNPI